MARSEHTKGFGQNSSSKALTLGNRPPDTAAPRRARLGSKVAAILVDVRPTSHRAGPTYPRERLLPCTCRDPESRACGGPATESSPASRAAIGFAIREQPP